MPTRPILALTLLALSLACHSAPTELSDRADHAASGAGTQLIEAPPGGDVPTLVRDALTRAQADHRTLIVYVGATWCEPCQGFHQAAARGELDTAFPTTTFLTFDLDRDKDRLKAAGYVSKFIPLFALPGPDGRASGVQVEGGIKGDGGVSYLTQKLQELLSR